MMCMEYIIRYPEMYDDVCVDDVYGHDIAKIRTYITKSQKEEKETYYNQHPAELSSTDH